MGRDRPFARFLLFLIEGPDLPERTRKSLIWFSIALLILGGLVWGGLVVAAIAIIVMLAVWSRMRETQLNYYRRGIERYVARICPKCSYNLRGIEGTTCPECGVSRDEFIREARRAEHVHRYGSASDGRGIPLLARIRTSRTRRRWVIALLRGPDWTRSTRVAVLVLLGIIVFLGGCRHLSNNAQSGTWMNGASMTVRGDVPGASVSIQHRCRYSSSGFVVPLIMHETHEFEISFNHTKSRALTSTEIEGVLAALRSAQWGSRYGATYIPPLRRAPTGTLVGSYRDSTLNWDRLPAAIGCFLVLLSFLTVAMWNAVRNAEANYSLQGLGDLRASMCPRCAYDLSGTDKETCPECGLVMREFEDEVEAVLKVYKPREEWYIHSRPKRDA